MKIVYLTFPYIKSTLLRSPDPVSNAKTIANNHLDKNMRKKPMFYRRKTALSPLAF